MKIIIRDFFKRDYPDLLRLLSAVYDSKIDLDTLLVNYISSNKSILIAEIDSRLVGCAFIEIQEDFIRPGKIIYVTYVAVDAAYRGNGIGSRLFREIEERGKDNHCASIQLTSADFREGAHKFYQAIGFSKKKTTVFIKEIE